MRSKAASSCTLGPMESYAVGTCDAPGSLPGNARILHLPALSSPTLEDGQFSASSEVLIESIEQAVISKQSGGSDILGDR